VCSCSNDPFFMGDGCWEDWNWEVWL